VTCRTTSCDDGRGERRLTELEALERAWAGEVRRAPADPDDAAPLTVPGLARSFFEQIGQFSTNRLWRQKVGGTRGV